ncbi:MAG: 2-phospho-L-lactate guanylyltransferase [Chloroflexi bacterium]|nr:MAG: 2-phospho-L-lactate guanylyltransferase [Chloroflexota bacterium]TMC71290.1 MAG: 2-phospho-L-lactate guanylyltransferase [Chloroflexota bacterium]
MRSEPVETWVIVLIKDLDSAKQRLGTVLDAKARRELALRNAERAIRAAAAGDARLVVAGSPEVVDIAERLGAPSLLEPRQEGQNVAAKRGIAEAVKKGAEAVVLLSSDLPLVTPKAVRDLLDAAGRIASPAAVAVPALGRGGTNALYLKPPEAITLHFGADSLAAFRREAEEKGVNFAIHRSEAMALDLDEPADLAHARRVV